MSPEKTQRNAKMALIFFGLFPRLPHRAAAQVLRFGSLAKPPVWRRLNALTARVIRSIIDFF
jgi:hypothetical protein